ncbi:hypothetical protein [Lysobacter sp. TAB13]|uniref:hypothetical protein n=1 Tax=Lysobacter sp. TAB13 TaxID=3233065 RepID=UPI003F999023
MSSICAGFICAPLRSLTGASAAATRLDGFAPAVLAVARPADAALLAARAVFAGCFVVGVDARVNVFFFAAAPAGDGAAFAAFFAGPLTSAGLGVVADLAGFLAGAVLGMRDS